MAHVVLAGGGTAGHVEPALAVADALRRLDPTVTISALGTARGLETTLVPARGYRLDLIPAVPLPRGVSRDLASVPSRLAGTVAAAGRVLADTGAGAVVGFGSYVALPAYLAARRRRVPIVVHEANARPGLGNRIGARLTRLVAAGTPECPLPNARYVGIPLRPAVAGLDRAGGRADAATALGLDPARPTLLAFGGSQGAQRLNTQLPGAAPALLAAGVQVLHLTGAGHGPAVAEAVAAAGAADGYHVREYLDRMDLGYAAADLALCRAGALTCAELAAVGLPAVYVPLPHGNGEQRLNAAPVVAAGGGVLLADADVTGGTLEGVLLPLLTDPARLAAMGGSAAGFGRRDADRAVARMVLAALGSPAAADRGTG